MNSLAIVTAIFLGFAALAHFYWALGGIYGIEKVIPKVKSKPAFKPGFIITLVVALFLLLVSVSSIALRWPIVFFEPWVKSFAFFISAIFMIRAIGDFNLVGFFKKEKDSDFAIVDTKYFSPLCLIWSVTFFVLAYSKA